MWILQHKTDPTKFVLRIHQDGRLEWTNKRRDALSFRDYGTAKNAAKSFGCNTYHIDPIW